MTSRRITAYLHSSVSVEKALAYLIRHWPGPKYIFAMRLSFSWQSPV
jgi:hypothetical protein